MKTIITIGSRLCRDVSGNYKQKGYIYLNDCMVGVCYTDNRESEWIIDAAMSVLVEAKLIVPPVPSEVQTNGTVRWSRIMAYCERTSTVVDTFQMG